jgi:hypothetical protein
MRHEKFTEVRLSMQDTHHLSLFHPHNFALGDRLGRRKAQRLANQAAFTQELIWAQDSDHRFSALLRGDHNLDTARADVEYGVSRASLPENDVVFAIAGNSPTTIDGGKEYLRIEDCFDSSRHANPPLLSSNSLLNVGFWFGGTILDWIVHLETLCGFCFPVYRLQFLGHPVEPYAALATGWSCF